MHYANHEYTLSTGRKLDANKGILGLICGDVQPWDTRLMSGFDNVLSVGAKENLAEFRTVLTPTERREIADHMMQMWDEWAKEIS